MMNKQTFKELISASAFKELFISEMGWNNPRGSIRLPNIVVDEVDYSFEQIAERSGFQRHSSTPHAVMISKAYE